MKTFVLLFVGLTTAASVFGQGQVVFQNTPSTAVFDCYGPVLPGVATAGLYYTTDLSATPSVTPPLDSWALAATTAIAPVAIFAGVYSGGTVTIQSVDPGRTVLMQVRAWSAVFETYHEAWASGLPGTEVGASNVMQVVLGGGSLPVPNLSTIVEPFTICIPEPSTCLLGLLAGLGALLVIRRQ